MNNETKQFLEQKFGAIDERLDQATASMRDLVRKSDLEGLATKADIADRGEAISALATHLDERFDELRPTLSKVEGHEARIQFLEERLPKLATH